MKQSDILTYAINGVQMELREAEQEVARLELVLEDLRATDKANDELSIGRPVEFVANCAQCRQRPCICGHM